MEEVPKSLEQWALDIHSNKQSWVAFYGEFLGTRPSNNPRLFRAINLYGFWPVFEAIVDSSARDLVGDPLPYILKVASNKFKEAQEGLNEEINYTNALDKSKKATEQANKALARRISKRKK
jgi:hypothetical protein